MAVSYANGAQDSATDSSILTKSPLDVSVDRAGEPDLTHCGDARVRNPLVLQLRYEGTKPLRGYVVGLYFPDPNSEATQRNAIDVDVVYPNRKLIAPGAEWKRTVCALPEGADPANVSVKVDLLGFEDGSKWGPMALRMSNSVLGLCEGIDFVQGQTGVAKLLSPVPLETNSVVGAGSNSSALGPLTMTPIIQRGDSGEDRLLVQATNMSSSPVRGYIFKVSFFDHATGTFIKSVSTKVLEMREEPSAYLAPGASWGSSAREVPRSTDDAPAVYKLTLDMVVLGDGRTFGPSRSPKSAELIGMLQAMSKIKAMQRRP